MFRFVKLRSMKPNVEAELDKLLDRNEMSRPVFKIKNDPRITRVGRFLRRSSVKRFVLFFNYLENDSYGFFGKGVWP